MVATIRVYPDPVLKETALQVGRVDDDARQLANTLVETMRAHERCVGLAANQIGVLRRCIVVDVTGHPRADSCSGLVVLFDPVILMREGSAVAREGCLSIPDLTANVRRARAVAVQGMDMSGTKQVVEANAFEARALQHEIDHLDGILFLDRVASLEHDVFRRRGT